MSRNNLTRNENTSNTSSNSTPASSGSLWTVFLIVILVIAAIIAIIIIGSMIKFPSQPTNNFKNGDTVRIKSLVANSGYLEYPSNCTPVRSNDHNPYLKNNCLMTFTGDRGHVWLLNTKLGQLKFANAENAPLKGDGNRLYMSDQDKTGVYALIGPNGGELDKPVDYVYGQLGKEVGANVFCPFFQLAETGNTISGTTITVDGYYRMLYNHAGGEVRGNNRFGRVRPAPSDGLSPDPNNAPVFYETPGISSWEIDTLRPANLDSIFFIETPP